ncbi:hypothetical protein GC173_00195 [bacterium]|nr:hypothetical protein [bacterium]
MWKVTENAFVWPHVAAAIVLAWLVGSLIPAIARECSLARRRDLSVCPINARDHLGMRLRGPMYRALMPAIVLLAPCVLMTAFSVYHMRTTRHLVPVWVVGVRDLSALLVNSVPFVFGIMFFVAAREARRKVSEPGRGLFAPLLVVGLLVGEASWFLTRMGMRNLVYDFYGYGWGCEFPSPWDRIQSLLEVCTCLVFPIWTACMGISFYRLGVIELTRCFTRVE